MAREMYTEAELEMIAFAAEDVITASGDPVVDEDGNLVW
jgi:hypothetical protein